MEFPDFSGMDIEAVKKLMVTEYPTVLYDIVYYDSPKKLIGMSNEAGTIRIVRQRVINSLKLEFTVSAFRDHL